MKHVYTYVNSEVVHSAVLMAAAVLMTLLILRETTQLKVRMMASALLMVRTETSALLMVMIAASRQGPTPPSRNPFRPVSLGTWANLFSKFFPAMSGGSPGVRGGTGSPAKAEENDPIPCD